MPDKWEQAPIVEKWEAAPIVEPESATGLQTEKAMLRNGWLRDAAIFALNKMPLSMKIAAGTGEMLAQAGTGALAAPVAGWAGLGAGALSNAPDAVGRIRDVANTVENVQQAMTYQPRTPIGQGMSEQAAVPFEQYQRFAKWLGDVSGDEEDTLGSALVESAVIAAPALAGLARRPTVAPQTPRQRMLASGNREGFVAPPTSAASRPTAGMLEGLGGKLKTQQVAQLRNQPVTNRLAARALGLPEGAEITLGTLEQLRASTTPIYSQMRTLGDVPIGTAFKTAVETAVRPFRNTQNQLPALGNKSIVDIADQLKNGRRIDSAVMVDAIQVLRSEADSAYRGGNAGTGRAYKGMAAALEEAMESHLSNSGNTSLLSDFRNARQLIAKTYSIQGALSGSDVNAAALSRQLARGKPLTGELASVAEFAREFPDAMRMRKDSVPAYSPLDAGYQMASVAGGLATGNPLVLLPAGYSLSRPMIRNYLLSPRGQRLAQPGAPNALTLSPAGATVSGVLAEDQLR